MGFHVVRCALNIHRAAGRIGFDAIARVAHLDDTSERVDPPIPLDVRNIHATGSGRNADVTSDIGSGNGSAGRGELGVKIDFFHADGTGGRLNFYRAANVSNRLRAGGNGGLHFGIVGNLNGVGNRKVAQVG